MEGNAPVIPVGLSRVRPSYADLAPPFEPGESYPELVPSFGEASGPPNPVYGCVRSALFALGLDEAHFGTGQWNPLGDLVAPGMHVVLKPNFIRHWNPAEDGSLESLITHGSVLRAVADYAALGVGRDGSVTVAEAPQHDCDFETVRTHTGLAAIQARHQQAWGHSLEVLDLRREAVTYRDGIIVERRSLPGDPRGYRAIDLGVRSCFHGAGLDPRRFRGADYDVTPTAEHHRAGRHEYLLSETVLSADLVVNLPKIKTHKKTGVTLAIKNLVGINGDKNWLPHHCVGSVAQGGDEYPGHAWIDRARSRATELARSLLKRGVGTAALRAARRLENAARGDDFVRSGNWYGNRTTWRMCIDLARCMLYTDARGAHLDAPQPIRRLLTVADGIVAGEGEGPLAPSDRPLGAVLAGLDPIALDLVALRLMGFDEARIPKVAEAMRARELPITQVRRPDQVVVFEATKSSRERKPLELCDLAPETPFRAHSGWRGHVEYSSCAGPDAA